jgi:hypothetical protein
MNMSRQIAYQQRSGVTPNPGSRSSLSSINLSANLTDISQLSQGTIGSKETAVQRHLPLQAELHQLEEDDVIEEDGIIVPEMPPPQPWHCWMLLQHDTRGLFHYIMPILLLLPIMQEHHCHTHPPCGSK